MTEQDLDNQFEFEKEMTEQHDPAEAFFDELMDCEDEEASDE